MEELKIKMFKGDFEEYLSQSVVRISRNDAEYAPLLRQMNEIRERNPKLTNLMEGYPPETISAEELAELSEFVRLDKEWTAMELRACYMRGFLDGTEAKKLFED